MAMVLPIALAAGPLRAQTTFSTEQLEQIVAPIALYPDNLLTQVLMASTYPLEIVEADRWLQKNKQLSGAALDAALKDQTWDASVKGLVHVPDVLTRMSENLDWTQDLGDAFLGQKSELMDTVQRMRARAHDAGNLKTTEQQVVTQQPDKIIVVESPDPEVVYVPTYAPTVVYGGWSYPSYYYPPMYLPPPAGYGLLAFGVGVAVGGAIWGDCNWGWGNTDIDIDVDRYNEFNRNTNRNPERTQVNPNRGGNRAGWQHDPSHRRGVNYQNPNVARQYGAGGNATRVSRDQARGYAQERGMPGDGGTRARAPGADSRERAGSRSGAAAGPADRGRNPATGGYERSRPAAGQPSRQRDYAGRDSALSGSRSSGFDRSASARGAASRGGSSFGGGGGRGGGGMRGGGGGFRGR